MKSKKRISSRLSRIQATASVDGRRTGSSARARSVATPSRADWRPPAPPTPTSSTWWTTHPSVLSVEQILVSNISFSFPLSLRSTYYLSKLVWNYLVKRRRRISNTAPSWRIQVSLRARPFLGNSQGKEWSTGHLNSFGSKHYPYCLLFVYCNLYSLM